MFLHCRTDFLNWTKISEAENNWLDPKLCLPCDEY